MYFIYCPILQNNSCKCFFIYFLNKVDIVSRGETTRILILCLELYLRSDMKRLLSGKGKADRKKAQKLGLPLKISLLRNAQRFVKAVIINEEQR